MVSRFIVLLVIGCWAACASAADNSRVSAPDFESKVKPLFESYCYGCHGSEKQKGDLSLEAFRTEAEALAQRPVWEKVQKNLESKEMPPSNKPQPTDAERDTVLKWIQTKALNCDSANPDPGRVTIRRLNRAEYNNTIRDLVGVDFRPADDFPRDDSGYGFDNIGDVLSLSPVLLEKYLIAAEKILDQAIITHPSPLGPTLRMTAKEMEVTGPNDRVDRDGIKLTREGHLSTNLFVPTDGSYLIRVETWGDQAGSEPPKLRIQTDGIELNTFDVKTRRYNPRIVEQRVVLSAGTNQLSFAYINNYVNRADPDPENRDRNLAIQWVEIIGPAGPQKYPDSHRRIFFKHPTSPDDAAHCAREIISRFATRAYRRPVKPDEVNRLMKLYEASARAGDNFETSVSVALKAILVSPHFLFRGEIQPEPNNSAKIVDIDEFALASRLSYFLWSTMPDERLFALAEKKKLRKNLGDEVHRMLRDPKAKAFVENFVGQWLQLRNLQFVQPDSTLFPGFDDNLRGAMEKETELLFSYILQHDRSALELLDANYTFLNQDLAEHYGLAGIRGTEFRKVTLKDEERGGVLTHGSILTLTSNPTRTSPVKRGKWVLENILGSPPPPPPPDVPDLPDVKGEALKGTLRQRMEQHRANPNCISCHERMDPLGFGLENFDGIGAWRSREGEQSIDASGMLITGEKFNGPAELRQILVNNKRAEFARCLSEKMLTYALGRGLEYYDKCAVDDISKTFARHNYKLSELVLAITESVPFQKRRGEQPK